MINILLQIILGILLITLMAIFKQRVLDEILEFIFEIIKDMKNLKIKLDEKYQTEKKKEYIREKKNKEENKEIRHPNGEEKERKKKFITRSKYFNYLKGTQIYPIDFDLYEYRNRLGVKKVESKDIFTYNELPPVLRRRGWDNLLKPQKIV
jgi:hypothetical protein